MQDRRVAAGIERGGSVTLTIDGVPVVAYVGETVAGVLVATGRRVVRLTQRAHEPRGVFCGMGVCYECQVTVDGVPFVRSCMTPVAEGMKVDTGVRQP